MTADAIRQLAAFSRSLQFTVLLGCLISAVVSLQTET